MSDHEVSIFANRAPCGTPGATLHTKISSMPRKSDGRRRVPNKYAANCALCGAPVLAGAGCVEKKSDGSGYSVFC